MDARQPAGVPGPQRPGRRDDVPGGARRRAQPRAVLQHGRDPAGSAGHAVHDRHGRPGAHPAAQAGQLRVHPQAGDGQGAGDRAALRHPDRRGVRARRMPTSSATSRRRCRWRSSATCSACCPRSATNCSSGPTTWCAVCQLDGRRADDPEADGHVRRVHRLHQGRDRRPSCRPHRRSVLGPGQRRGRGPEDVRRRDRLRDAADPHRRRRDHPAHALGRHRSASAAPGSVAAAGGGCRVCCPAPSRRCCAGPRR